MVGIASIIVDQSGVCKLGERILGLIEPTIVTGVMAVLQDTVHSEAQVQPPGHPVLSLVEDGKPVVVFVDVTRIVMFVVEDQVRLVSVRHVADGYVVLLHDLVAQEMFGILLGVIVLSQLSQQLVHFGFGNEVFTQPVVCILYGGEGAVFIEGIVSERDPVVYSRLFGNISVHVVVGLGIHLLGWSHIKVVGIIQVPFLMDGEICLYINADTICLARFFGVDHNDAGRSPRS